MRCEYPGSVHGAKSHALLAGKAQTGGQPTRNQQNDRELSKDICAVVQFPDSAQLGLCVLRAASTIGSGPPAVTRRLRSTAALIQITFRQAKPAEHAS